MKFLSRSLVASAVVVLVLFANARAYTLKVTNNTLYEIQLQELNTTANNVTYSTYLNYWIKPPYTVSAGTTTGLITLASTTKSILILIKSRIPRDLVKFDVKSNFTIAISSVVGSYITLKVVNKNTNGIISSGQFFK